MDDASEILERDLSGLSATQWRAELATLSEDLGMYQPLGPRHFATFIDQSNTLLVSFESSVGIQNLSSVGQPLGFDLVKSEGWSHLCLISDGDTWFRDEEVYGFFDQLIDDGFFDEFEKVVFYGGGPCAYAAAAFSVAAPGATVLLIQPQATLDPDIAGWDDRFTEMRKLSFRDRYGYAPDMLEAAEQAFVIYDPKVTLDAMHATLFRADNVEMLRMPHMGEFIQTRLLEMGVLHQLLTLTGKGQLTPQAFHQLARARRDHRGYLRHILGTLDSEDRSLLSYYLCANVTRRLSAPRFRNRLQALKTELFPEGAAQDTPQDTPENKAS